MDLRSNLENRFEADTFLANVSLGVSFRRLASTAYSSDMVLVEAILVRIDDDLVRVEPELKERLLVCTYCIRIRVILGVLYQLIDEACVLRVKIVDETGMTPISKVVPALDGVQLHLCCAGQFPPYTCQSPKYFRPGRLTVFARNSPIVYLNVGNELGRLLPRQLRHDRLK